MAGLFDSPKPPSPVPVVNPADTQNRQNSALANRLQAGGANADTLAAPGMGGAVGGARLPTLTGLN